ncbi:MAG: Tol-Pal system beta propeller repeat protein TolB [Candidatus Parabeggiatoa sp.]|nr:Tol-Pal system beta propeller repeat protein TolB [Candidatus Parabeggiatoa sp.]
MRTLILCLLGYFAILSQAHAILNIDIIGGKEEGGQPIAVVPFQLRVGTQQPAQNIANIVSNNLYRSGRFATMPNHQLLEQPYHSNQISYSRWQAAGMPHLVIGRIAGGVVRGYTVEFELIDIYKRQRLIGFRYNATSETLRQVAHQISNEIYLALTGKRGIFTTQIVYVTLQGRGKQNQYHLYIADADGANPRLMLRSSEPIFSPSWSPDKRHIAYVTYDHFNSKKRMVVYIQEIRTGRRARVSAQPGMNTAPAWSPDGRRLALTLSQDGNPEIYIMEVYDHALTRLTHDPAIDTEPDWAPDGRSLVFTSDRSGQPQIYRMSTSGQSVQRLTFQGSYNARPRYSPDGTQLALLHGNHQRYQIAILNLKSKQLKILTQTTLDESPSFAPNGSMIIYATGSELAAVSIDGRVHQRLATNMNEEVREPAWSPFYQK